MYTLEWLSDATPKIDCFHKVSLHSSFGKNTAPVSLRCRVRIPLTPRTFPGLFFSIIQIIYRTMKIVPYIMALLINHGKNSSRICFVALGCTHENKPASKSYGFTANLRRALHRYRYCGGFYTHNFSRFSSVIDFFHSLNILLAPLKIVPHAPFTRMCYPKRGWAGNLNADKRIFTR